MVIQIKPGISRFIDNIQEIKLMSKIILESHTKNLARRLSTTARREKRKDNKKIGATQNYSL